jgi:S1-C subfamily serine protease
MQVPIIRAAVCLAAILTVLDPACAVDESVLDAQRRRIGVVRKVASSVVAIFGKGGQGGGSGVLVSPDGYALSNFHVTRGAGTFMKCGLNDGVLYDAVIVGIDPTGDVALVKLLGRDDFPYANMGDSDAMKVGDWAYAMGNPFLLATDFQPTVTYGIVSGVHRYQYPAGTFLEYADCIQVDSSINPGNSGGPLFNDDGDLVGINGRGSFEKRGRVNSGAGYAISINQIRYFLDHLRSGRIVDHATLGATVTTAEDGHVVISSILESSEAYRRGLRLDHEVVKFAGRPIRSVNQFKNILGIYPKGWRLALTYRHEETKYEIMARLRGVHRQAELMPGRPKPKPAEKKPEDGKPGDKKPKAEKPKPAAGKQPASTIPEKFKHMFVRKAGFANYYFNQQEQDRLKPLVDAWGDYSGEDGTWQLAGESADSEAFKLTLASKGLGLELNEEPFYQALDGSDFADEPAGSGGLLVAMHHLKLLLTKGSEGFSEYYYLGSEPLDLTGQLVDVIVTSLEGVETRWYFSRSVMDGEQVRFPAAFVGFSCQLLEDRDECEVYFATVRKFGNRSFPGEMVVRVGGREYLRLLVENFNSAVSRDDD